jgi:hypothetical protein
VQPKASPVANPPPLPAKPEPGRAVDDQWTRPVAPARTPPKRQLDTSDPWSK